MTSMSVIRSAFLTAVLGASLFSAVVVPGVALAADEQNVSKGGALAGSGVAVHSYDVVSFFSGQPMVGSDKFAIAHNGATYRFTSQANLDAFKAAPAKYEPAFGGYCAYGVVLGKKLDGDPRYWKVVNGKLYLNVNGDVQAKWSEDVSGNINKGNDSWTKIKSVAADKL